MKKFVSGCLAVMAFFLASTTFAQQNVTFVVKDKVEKGYFDKTTFPFNVKVGSQSEATAFYNKMRALPEVSSVEDMGKDADGSYKGVAKLKAPKDAQECMAMAVKVGVTHVEVDGKTKTVQEWMQSTKKKERTISRTGPMDQAK